MALLGFAVFGLCFGSWTTYPQPQVFFKQAFFVFLVSSVLLYSAFLLFTPTVVAGYLVYCQYTGVPPVYSQVRSTHSSIIESKH